MSSTSDYLIWSNEHRAWWAPAGWGYSPGLNDAGRYSRREAIAVCRKAIYSASHVGHISEIPVRVADLEEVLKDQTSLPAAITGEKKDL